ncbi:unnamed protein product [Sphagnum jensenii]
MSNKTTTQTNTANQYSQSGMNNYNAFQGTLMNNLSNYAQNPLASSFFQNQLGMAQNNASQIGQRNMSNITNNLRTGGGLLGNSGSFMQSQINRAAGQNSANQSNAFNTTLNSALQNRQWATSAMEAYQPLQTGQNTNQTQTQSMGLGSILGSLGGLGLNLAMPGLNSMLGGGSFSGGYGQK